MKFLVILLCCIIFSMHAAQVALHSEQKGVVLPPQMQKNLYPIALPVEPPLQRYKIPFILLYFIDFMCNKFCGD